MIRTIKKLYTVNLLSPWGIIALLRAFNKHGKNLLALLEFSSRFYPNRTAIKDDNSSYTYAQFYEKANKLACFLSYSYKIDKKKKVVILCKNHSICLINLVALSRLGCDVVFLNADMSSSQLSHIMNQQNFDLLIYDNVFHPKIAESKIEKIPCFLGATDSIESILNSNSKINSIPHKNSSGHISVLTGGTSGKIKFAKRKATILNFVLPFFTLLKELNLDHYKKIYIAVPFYHGYGLASVILSMVLSVEIYLKTKFDSLNALELIKKNKIEVLAIVPTMLKRMLDKSSDSLASVQVIVTGGAPIDRSLVEKTLSLLGDKLYNLFGTSEAGFSVIALPEDLKKYPDTIGKKIWGVDLVLLDKDNNRVKEGDIGTLHIKNQWSMSGTDDQYISTGDLGFYNKEGYLFLKGRIDDMIVSGGENVYPYDIEALLLTNPKVDSVAVIAIKDKDFGKRLNAFVTPQFSLEELSETSIKNWLSSRLARYQLPSRVIIVKTIPFSSTGKLDKKKLLEFLSKA